MRQNLELKARCADLAAVRAKVLALPPRARSVQEQTDTYFHVKTGRLKLREIEGQGGELIWYDRPNDPNTRVSRYHLLPVPDAEGIQALLAAALGIRGTVHKYREIYLWKNIRIHLDQVKDLGCFVEFEAVLQPTDELDESQLHIQSLCHQLGIDSAQAIPTSYSDLLNL